MGMRVNEVHVVLQAEDGTSWGFRRHDRIDGGHHKWTRTFETYFKGEHRNIDKEELPRDLYQDENYAVICNSFRTDGHYGPLYCTQYRKYPDGTYQKLTIDYCDDDTPVHRPRQQITLEEIPRFHGAQAMETQRVLLQKCRHTTRCEQKQITLADDDAPLKSFTQVYVDGKILCILESSSTRGNHTHEIILWPVGDTHADNGDEIDFYERIKRPRREMWIDGEFSEEIELPASYEGIWSHAKQSWDFWQPKGTLSGHEIDKPEVRHEIDKTEVRVLLHRMGELVRNT